MIVLICGLPKSGKSVFVDKLFGIECHLIRPSDYIPNNYENMPNDIQQNLNIEAWKVGIETAEDILKDIREQDDYSQVLVYDMCNKNSNPLEYTLKSEKRRGHKIVVIYINCPTKVCKDRCGFSDEIMNTYVEGFKKSLPKYKSISNEFIVVDNKGSLEDLDEHANNIRDKLCLNT